MPFQNTDDSHSFYLREIARSPVNWHSCGEQAVVKARTRGAPIFLSIGCSSSHWCHVMDEECFENERVAKFLNESFVCIKVDREERPDIAKVCMTFLKILEGDMPLSVFLTPKLEPFAGGSYYPRSLFEITLSIFKEAWDENKKDDSFSFANCLNALPTTATSRKLQDGLSEKVLYLCAKQLALRYNEEFGGLGSSSKFPRPVEIQLMLYHSKTLREAGKSGEANEVMEMVSFTLQCMAMWGIHDHIGGGFHRIGTRFRNIIGPGFRRYSIVERSPVPHFEKMLYDQGQLASVYLDAFSFTKDPFYSHVSRDILDFLRRDMKGHDGEFFSAVDADSGESEGEKKREGAFYQWTTSEVERILETDATLFMDHYNIQPMGNCVHNEFKGKNVLKEATSPAAMALNRERMYCPILGKCREKLFEARSYRPSPDLDKTVIVSWNGLVISSLARASKILRDESESTKFNFPVTGCDPEEYIGDAEKAASFIKQRLYNKRTLSHSFWNGLPSKASGFLDDYAFLISGLLDLYEFGGGTEWLKWAIELQDIQDELFLDREGGGYYNTTDKHTCNIHRVKDLDGAVPSGNSVSVINLARLDSVIGGDCYRKTAEHLLAVFEKWLKDRPTEVPLMCCAAEMLSVPRRTPVVLIHSGSFVGFEDMLAAAHASYNPNRRVIHIDVTKDMMFWWDKNPYIARLARRFRSYARGRVVAYVEQDLGSSHCFTDPNLLKAHLSGEEFGKKKRHLTRCESVHWKPLVPPPQERERAAIFCGVMFVDIKTVERIRSNLEQISCSTGAKLKIIDEDKTYRYLKKIEITGGLKERELARDMVMEVFNKESYDGTQDLKKRIVA